MQDTVSDNVVIRMSTKKGVSRNTAPRVTPAVTAPRAVRAVRAVCAVRFFVTPRKRCVVDQMNVRGPVFFGAH